MNALSLRRLALKTTSVLLSSALILTAPGLSCYEAVAAEIRIQRNVEIGRGSTPIQPLGVVGAALNPSLGSNASGSLRGSLSTTQGAPELSAGPRASIEGALEAPAAAFQLTPSALPRALPAAAIAAPIAQAAAPQANLFQRLFGSLSPSQPAGPQAEEEGRAKLQAALAPSAATLASPSDSKTWAADAFAALGGAEVSGAPVAAPVGWSKRAVTVVGGVLGLSVLSAARPVSSAPAPTVADPAPSAEGLAWLAPFGQAGYVIGNFLAFLFSIPQIHKTFKDGDAKSTPAWRAAVFAAAGLALGLVSATVADKAFWGIQNVFGAVSMLSVYPVAWWLRRGAKINPLVGTAVVTLAALVASVGLYYGAAAIVPTLLAHLMAPAAVSQAMLWIQAATGALYFLLFLPDMISVARGQAPKSFTPAFSLAFFAASAAFVVWTVQAALAAVPGSPQQMQFLIYAGLNAAYAAVSFASYYFARKAARKEAGPQAAVGLERPGQMAYNGARIKIGIDRSQPAYFNS